MRDGGGGKRKAERGKKREEGEKPYEHEPRMNTDEIDEWIKGREAIRRRKAASKPFPFKIRIQP